MIKPGPNSIAPIHQDRPPLWSGIAVVALVILCLSPFGFVLMHALGLLP